MLGANGAGKSLFLNLCHGLIEPSRGELAWCSGNGAQPIDPPSQTMVFQTPVMLKRTVLENLIYVIRQRSRTDVEQQALSALEWAGLSHLASRPALRLSLGEQQQLAIARAWVLAPQLLFLDEPTASLDPRACQRIEALIAKMHRDGTRIVMATHNLAQARRLAQQVIFLHEGEVACYQPVDSFFSQPARQEAKDFIQWEAAEKQV